MLHGQLEAVTTRKLKVAVLVACTILIVAWAQPGGPVLTVYRLAPAEEAQYGHADGVVSPFWGGWDGRDSLLLVPPDNCFPGNCGFSGPDDAQVVVKAAGSDSGLYLYIETVDNNWLDRAGGTQIDNVVVGIDTNAAYTMLNCGDCLAGYYMTALSHTSQWFEVFYGGAISPDSLRLAYDNGQWCSFGCPDELSFDSLRTLHGAEIEIVALDATCKAQEWYLPWSFVGLDRVPDQGQRLAFCAGYDDKDSGQGDADLLRWLGRDPWAHDARETNYWGDLLIGAGFPSGVINSARPSASRSIYQPERAASFSLRGQRLPQGSAQSVGTVVVRQERVGREEHCTLRVVARR